MSVSHDGSPDPGDEACLAVSGCFPPRRPDVEVAQQRRGRVPGLPPAAPNLGEGADVAEHLADLGLALRDAQLGQFRGQLVGGAIATGDAGRSAVGVT